MTTIRESTIPTRPDGRQRYLTSQNTERVPEIIEAKRAAKDYEVQFVTLNLDGEMLRIVVDGHHSHSAAALDGVPPRYVPADAELQLDANVCGPEYLCHHRIDPDADWTDIDTGENFDDVLSARLEDLRAMGRNWGPKTTESLKTTVQEESH